MTAPQRVAALNRPNMVSVGTIVFLSQELMVFAGLFAMSFVSRANGQGETWDYGASHLNVPYALTITIILVASSFTAQAGVFAAERGDVFALRRWYAISALMGTVFLVGQGYEYYHLVEFRAVCMALSSTSRPGSTRHTSWLAFWPSSSSCFVWQRASSPRLRQLQPWWCHTTGTLLTLSGSACLPPSTSFNKPFWSDSPKIKGK